LPLCGRIEVSLSKIRNLERQLRGFGRHDLALSNVDLALDPGDFVVALGASGCGKTTLLSHRRFHGTSAGNIILMAGRRSGPSADRGVVFQHALMPWLNVVDNVESGCACVACSMAARNRARHLVGLESFAQSPVYQISAACGNGGACTRWRAILK
jgi:taurine transport system ATP-binding protein